MDPMLDGVTWFRQSSIRIRRGGMEVHVDPRGILEASHADCILLTHPHYDTFSEEDIGRVRGPDTRVMAPASMKKQLLDADHFMRPGDLLQFDGLDVLAVPAYNKDRSYHHPDSQWLGYVFTLDGVTYYHAGDTDYLDSMKDISCDVAFLPLAGRYTMGPDEAARAGIACEASIVVPVHWGDAVGLSADADRVARLFPGKVEILARAAQAAH